MKNKIRNNRPSFNGSIETLLVIPVFLMLTWGIAILGLKLLQESRLQQSAWTYAMSKAHKASDTVALSAARDGIPNSTQRASLKVDPDSGMLETLAGVAGGVVGATKPYAFFGFLAAKAPKHQKLSIEQRVPEIFAQYVRAAESVSTPSEEGGLRDTIPDETRVLIPGDDFSGSGTLQKALLAEALLEAGFCIPLIGSLGLPELTYAATGVDSGCD